MTDWSPKGETPMGAEAAKAAADERIDLEDRLRRAGWHQTDDGLWTAEGVPVPMGLSGARIVLAGIEASVERKARSACA